MFEDKVTKTHGTSYGTTTVGARGQIVIPAGARKAFNLKSKDKLFIFGMGGNFLTLIKADQVEKMMEKMMEKMKTMTKIIEKSNNKK